MEKNRGTVIAVVAALVVAVISLGVAFASFSASLTINGNATIQTSNWDIHYSTTSQGAAPTASPVVSVEPTVATATSSLSTLTDSTFTWSASFKSPGDTVEYRFYIVNNGDYNAKLTTLPTVSAPTCTYTNGTTPAPSTCPITYTVTTDGSTAFVENQALNAHSSQLVVVRASLNSNYGGDGESLFGSEVSVATQTVTFGYTQDGTAVSGS